MCETSINTLSFCELKLYNGVPVHMQLKSNDIWRLLEATSRSRNNCHTHLYKMNYRLWFDQFDDYSTPALTMAIQELHGLITSVVTEVHYIVLETGSHQLINDVVFNIALQHYNVSNIVSSFFCYKVNFFNIVQIYA